jgi:two-component sensor histidine kinase/PAS domain-containing protein
MFRHMADAVPCAMAVISGADHRVIYANPAFHRLAGGDPAGQVLAGLLPAMDDAAIAEAQRGGQPFRQPGVMLRLLGDGTPSWWDFTLVPLAAADAGPPAVLVTAQEVTDHVLSRRDTAATTATLDALLAHIPEGVTIARGPGVTVERVSAHGAALARRSEAELTGADVLHHPQAWDVWLPDSDTKLDPQDRPLARAMRDGTVMDNETLMLRRPDGSVVPVLCSAGPIRNVQGEITGAVMVWRDVTDLHRAEAALRASEERLRIALQAGGLGIWEVDLATGHTAWDARVMEMLGLTGSEDAAGPAGPLILADHIHPEDRVHVTAYSCEFRAMTGQGEERWLASEGVVVRERMTGVLRDITQRRRREKRLEEALVARDLLAREADHRIKNSLQLIASLLQLQRSRLIDPDAGAALDDAIVRVQAVGEAHRALHQSADLRSIDLGAMLADLCAHIGGLNQAVRLVCTSDADLQVDAERAIPLGLIVSELLTNAAKHAYPDGMSGDVRVTAQTITGRVVVRVQDDGVGMPATEGGRSGLGSSIMRALARQIGATVAADTARQRGTAVTLDLPLQAGEDAAG